MSQGAPVAARIAAEYAAVADRLPANLIAPEQRRGALLRLGSLPLPAARDENWKYANLRPLERLRFAPLLGTESSGPGRAELPSALPGFSRQVFLDGRRVPALCDALPELARASASLPPAAERCESGRQIAPAELRLALLNDAFATDALAIRIGRGAEQVCLELLFLARTAGERAASYPRLSVELESGARVTLVERHLSLGSEPAFVNARVDLALGPGSQLDHYRLQDLAPRACWFDTSGTRVGADAEYALCGVTVGAQSSRSTARIELAGEGARTRIGWAAAADRGQVQDAFVEVVHAVPRGRSEQTFRGLAASRGRAAFNGRVTVGAQARGTDSTQSLRGLLEGEDAEVDVRPQLEIHTDEVRCSHGATAGKLDENMLFYMLARGLDRETAGRLLKWAFLEDVVARVALPALRREIEQRLAGQLREADQLKEML